ncbi:hypothetical protein [Natronolimnohabitans innermongolicus]|nr:hypothetical protein [Natronolimnohabitans innermongolicus]
MVALSVAGAVPRSVRLLVALARARLVALAVPVARGRLPAAVVLTSVFLGASGLPIAPVATLDVSVLRSSALELGVVGPRAALVSVAFLAVLEAATGLAAARSVDITAVAALRPVLPPVPFRLLSTVLAALLLVLPAVAAVPSVLARLLVLHLHLAAGLSVVGVAAPALVALPSSPSLLVHWLLTAFPLIVHRLLASLASRLTVLLRLRTLLFSLGPPTLLPPPGLAVSLTPLALPTLLAPVAAELGALAALLSGRSAPDAAVLEIRLVGHVGFELAAGVSPPFSLGLLAATALGVRPLVAPLMLLAASSLWHIRLVLTLALALPLGPPPTLLHLRPVPIALSPPAARRSPFALAAASLVSARLAAVLEVAFSDRVRLEAALSAARLFAAAGTVSLLRSALAVPLVGASFTLLATVSTLLASASSPLRIASTLSWLLTTPLATPVSLLLSVLFVFLRISSSASALLSDVLLGLAASRVLVVVPWCPATLRSPTAQFGLVVLASATRRLPFAPAAATFVSARLAAVLEVAFPDRVRLEAALSVGPSFAPGAILSSRLLAALAVGASRLTTVPFVASSTRRLTSSTASVASVGLARALGAALVGVSVSSVSHDLEAGSVTRIAPIAAARRRSSSLEPAPIRHRHLPRSSG